MPIIRLDPDSTIGRQMQKLQTLYYALITVPLMLFLIFYLQANQPTNQPYLQRKDLMWVHILVWVLVLALSALALRSYKKRNTRALQRAGTMEEKFLSYVRESRRLYLLLTPIMFLPVLAIWATGVIFYGALFALMIILVASVRPMAEQFIQRYQLSKEEVAALQQQT